MIHTDDLRHTTWLEKALLSLVLFLIGGCLVLLLDTQRVIGTQHSNAQIGYGNRAVACLALQAQSLALPAPCKEDPVVKLMRP